MNKKRIILSTIIAIMLVVSGFFGFSKHVQAVNSAKYVQTSTPTLFFHGYGSSFNAETQMTNAAKKAGVTKKIVRVNVSPNGYAKIIGSIPKSAKNPIVEVNYDNNKMSNYHTAGKWAANVIKVLQKDYKFKSVNLVGHSMGNMAINYYIMDNAGKKGMPKVNKVVDIAGHFNGILGMNDQPNQMKLDKDGKPTKMDKDYKELLKLRKVYPTNTDILNIYGDKNDGTHSDGDVSNASSMSLKYLVSGRAHSYQEKKIVGKQAQHSKLHENKEVDKLLINFLWKK
ncbi:alpha/beta hydrolase [Companilactobacillus kimchiensis]|uniref:Putative cell surface hydrolase (Putative) n=1 Tax=Companilactobacillus kimchiensis TaxID=993692 RepID=A0A0R2LBE0_9LACO|nr:alpha/beta hydrolase [Companilactobacillus kimchiensis]KRN99139.1 putative cell surface hydrolase (putative) [Companilactobacillus kimchiensis]